MSTIDRDTISSAIQHYINNGGLITRLPAQRGPNMSSMVAEDQHDMYIDINDSGWQPVTYNDINIETLLTRNLS